MLERVLQFSVHHRVLVLLVVLAVAGVGSWSLSRLPIDAVPDITNNQIQINTAFPSLSPEEVEQQITFPIETALAGVPGLVTTRSTSRNGFSQVQAVFEDGVDIYFARNQVTERLSLAKEELPDGAEPRMGPIATGLGEVFMYTVKFEHPGGGGEGVEDGRPGWQSDGAYLTPRFERLEHVGGAGGLPADGAGLDHHPQLKGVKDVAGVDSIGGYVKQYAVQPEPMKLVSYGITFGEVIAALNAEQREHRGGYVERNGEAYLVRSDARVRNEEEIGRIVVGTRHGTPVRVADVASVGIGVELRTGSAARTDGKSCSARR